MIIVDTNILVYRWVPGPRNSATEALVRIDPIWAAPLLWRSEFRQVLGGAIRSAKMSAAEAEQLMGHATASLLGGEHVVADRIVLDLVARSRCTAYDCEFAGLALALGTILVTEDRALLASLPRLCRSLDEATDKSIPR